MEVLPEDPQLHSNPEAQPVFPDVATAPEPRSPNSFFFGRFGLRAGYGIAIFIVCWLIFNTIGSIFAVAANGQLHEIMNARMQAQAHPHAPHPHVQINFTALFVTVSDGITFLGMLGLCWFFSRGERRRLGVYGIGSSRWKDVFPGALWGLIMMSALVALLHGMHLLIFDSRALSGGAAVFFGLKWLLAFLLVGLAEEYMFRGYIQYTLMRGVWGLAEKISPVNPRPFAFWIASTTLSLLFLAAHTGNAGETKFGLVAVFLAGLLFSYALWRTGSLWWGIGFHMAWDWAQSFLFGVADSGNISIGRLFVTHAAGNPVLSGGQDGPEGSVFVIIFLLLSMAVLRFTRPGTQPSLERGPISTAGPHEMSASIS